MSVLLAAAAGFACALALSALLHLLTAPRHIARVVYRCNACGATHESPFVGVAAGAIVPVPRPPDGWVSLSGERHACSAECARTLRGEDGAL